MSLLPFLANKLAKKKKKSRSKSLWIFFIILQDGRNRSRNIHWMLAFLRALEGMQKIEDTGALASGTFQDSWRHKADILFDSGNHLFIHLNVHETYLLSTYFASGTRCRCWQHGVDKDLHFGLKESLHGLLGHKAQQPKLLRWAGGDGWSGSSERGPHVAWAGREGPGSDLLGAPVGLGTLTPSSPLHVPAPWTQAIRLDQRSIIVVMEEEINS